MNEQGWPALRERFTRICATRTRDECCAHFEGVDGCLTPVLAADEVADHPHNRQRTSFVEVAGVVQPAPAPRFSRTPASVRIPPPARGQDTAVVLRDWGIGADDVDSALGEHVIG
jgi:alpha-methylacyl-CoA racemase